MRFRSKDPERVLDELSHLVKHYGARTVWGTDNIIDSRYFSTVLPEVKRRGLTLNLFFETKANLRKDHLRTMRDAGMRWFQPGIESLNTHQLQLMQKGCTALQNIQLLKWVRQLGMAVTWNVLMGFPGETSEDYQLMARYCKLLTHLQPPSGAHPIRLDRFSPYHDRAAENGLVQVRPCRAYQFIYPFNLESLSRLAYFFEFSYMDGYDPLQAGEPLLKAISEWVRPESLSVLYAVPGDQSVMICDTRPVAASGQRLLLGWEASVYVLCDEIRGFDAIVRHARTIDPSLADRDVKVCLDDWIEQHLMLEENGNYLSLAVLADKDTEIETMLDQRLKKSTITVQEESEITSASL